MLRTLYRYNPRIGDITFHGYTVTEEWEDIRKSAAIPLAATLAVSSTFLFRGIFKDWQTAIEASALVVAVMALIVQWMMYAASKV